MTELFISLQTTPGIDGVHLKQVCGKDELVIEDTSTRAALMLLNGLIREGRDEKCDAAKISTPDRDRILAFLYMSMYGPKVESTVTCENCREPFDLDFLLSDLISHYQPLAGGQLDGNTYQVESGGIFRLPTGEDELLLADVPQSVAENFLIKRCLVKGDPERDAAEIEAKMAEIAPILDIEIQAVCPECGQELRVRFDIQSFLLTKLRQQRPLLIQEIHSIAVNYHWSQKSILALPRSLRKQYAGLIESTVA